MREKNTKESLKESVEFYHLFVSILYNAQIDGANIGHSYRFSKVVMSVLTFLAGE